MRAKDFLKSTLTTVEQCLEKTNKRREEIEHDYKVVEKRIDTIKRLKAQLVSETRQGADTSIQEEGIRERIQKLESAFKTREGLESELFDAKVALREILSSEKEKKEALDKIRRLELELKMRDTLESEIFALRLELKQLYAKKEDLDTKIKELESKGVPDEHSNNIFPKRKISLTRLVRRKRSLSDLYGIV